MSQDWYRALRPEEEWRSVGTGLLVPWAGEGSDLVPDFTWTPDPVYTGVEVTFDASASVGAHNWYWEDPTPPGGWSFGEGVNSETYQFTFQNEGPKQIRLTITDENDENPASLTKAMEVYADPEATPTPTPTPISTPPEYFVSYGPTGRWTDVLGISTPSYSTPATTTVSPGGLQSAIDNASAGDVIEVSPGSANYDSDLPPLTGGPSSGQNILVRPQLGSRGSVNLTADVRCQRVTFAGFTVGTFRFRDPAEYCVLAWSVCNSWSSYMPFQGARDCYHLELVRDQIQMSSADQSHVNVFRPSNNVGGRDLDRCGKVGCWERGSDSKDLLQNLPNYSDWSLGIGQLIFRNNVFTTGWDKVYQQGDIAIGGLEWVSNWSDSCSTSDLDWSNNSHEGSQDGCTGSSSQSVQIRTSGTAYLRDNIVLGGMRAMRGTVDVDDHVSRLGFLVTSPIGETATMVYGDNIDENSSYDYSTHPLPPLPDLDSIWST